VGFAGPRAGRVQALGVFSIPRQGRRAPEPFPAGPPLGSARSRVTVADARAIDAAFLAEEPGDLRSQVFGAFKQDQSSCLGLDRPQVPDDATPYELRERRFLALDKAASSSPQRRLPHWLVRAPHHRPDTNEQTGCNYDLCVRGSPAAARHDLSSCWIEVARPMARLREPRQEAPFSKYTLPCPACKKAMYMVARERPSDGDGVNTLTFKCRCGQFSTATTNQ
jgi:hypothetical protein